MTELLYYDQAFAANPDNTQGLITPLDQRNNIAVGMKGYGELADVTPVTIPITDGVFIAINPLLTAPVAVTGQLWGSFLVLSLRERDERALSGSASRIEGISSEKVSCCREEENGVVSLDAGSSCVEHVHQARTASVRHKEHPEVLNREVCPMHAVAVDLAIAPDLLTDRG